MFSFTLFMTPEKKRMELCDRQQVLSLANTIDFNKMHSCVLSIIFDSHNV